MLHAFFLSLLVLCSIPTLEPAPPVTKVVFRLIPPDSFSPPASVAPKTIYVAGDRYARIEQPGHADTKNLIIVSEPDIWVVDGEKKQASHMINPGPDLTVHNPILGPEGPEDLFDFEYGRELRFFEHVTTKSLGFKEIEGIGCDVHELRSGDYRIVMNVTRVKNIPHSIQIFLNDRPVLHLQYLGYEKDIPFDPALFRPPDGIQITESSQ